MVDQVHPTVRRALDATARLRKAGIPEVLAKLEQAKNAKK